MIALKQPDIRGKEGGRLAAWIKKISYPPVPIALNKYVWVERV